LSPCRTAAWATFNSPPRDGERVYLRTKIGGLDRGSGGSGGTGGTAARGGRGT
jgi:hypothetical protein